MENRVITVIQFLEAIARISQHDPMILEKAYVSRELLQAIIESYRQS
jgi:hypothetical protein